MTNTPSPEGLVEVTQQDRDAAAATSVTVAYEMLASGGGDDHPLVQAFARHRLASTPSAVPVNVKAGEREALIEQEAIDLIVDLCGPGASQSGTNCRVVEDHLKQFARRLAALSTPATPDNAASEGEVERERLMCADLVKLWDTGVLPEEAELRRFGDELVRDQQANLGEEVRWAEREIINRLVRRSAALTQEKA